MENYELQYLVLNFLEHVQLPHCCGHSPIHFPTVADIDPTVADIPTVADTLTSVVILGYML